MKKLLLLLLYLTSITSFSQNDIPDSDVEIPKGEGQRNKIISFLTKNIYSTLNKYCDPPSSESSSIKLSGDNFFEKRLKNVFSTVVTTTSDVVENGSAFSYVKDKDANTLSVNGAFYKSTKREHKYIFDIGVSTKMESDAYKFYSKGSFSNDITGTLGISYVFNFTNKWKNHIDYISECDSVNQIRWQFVNDTLIPKYNKLYKWSYDPELLNEPLPKELTREKGPQFQTIINKGGVGEVFLKDKNDDLINTYVASSIRIKQINDILKNKFNFTHNTTPYTQPSTEKITITEKSLQIDNLSKGSITVDGIKTTYITIDTSNGEKITLVESKELDLKKELKDLIEIRNTAIELLRLRDNVDKDDYPVKSYIEKKFEKFDSTHDASFGYSICWTTLKASFSNSAITINNQDIIDENIQVKIDNLFKFSTELSGNYSRSMKSFHYFKLYTKFNRGSLLDSQILKTDGFNIFAETSTIPTSYVIQNDDGETIANYNDLRNPVYNIDFGLYYATLCLAEKNIGFSAQVSFNSPVSVTNIEYKPTYTLLLGLLVKAKADAVIINLSSGFENQYYSTNAWDNFIVKASIGVPFTIFEKKAKK
ncbi:hypothetical protein [Flavobacterium notoginsengisoli]|uniref:hypothetical protein n=1 Tax=Flavobacterium notoginsengisoli TaxID=1478199 RepID=UPI00362A9467